MSCVIIGNSCNDGSSSNSHAYSDRSEFADVTHEKIKDHIEDLPANTPIEVVTKGILSVLCMTAYALSDFVLKAGFGSSFCLNFAVGAVLIGLVIAAEVDHTDLHKLQEFHTLLMEGVNQVRRCGSC